MNLNWGVGIGVDFAKRWSQGIGLQKIFFWLGTQFKNPKVAAKVRNPKNAKIATKTRPRQSVPNSGFHLVGPGLILVNLVQF